MTLQWKRARRNSVGAHVWPSRCDRYLIAAHDWCYGVKLAPVMYTAWAHGRKISTHRTRGAAVRACEKHSRRFAIQHK